MNSTDMISGFNISLDLGIAQNLGIDAAIIYNHITYWLKINARKSETELIEGKYWMYETNKQMADFFGIYTEDQVSRAIKKLTDAELIIKKCLSKNPFDRTSWYTVSDQGLLKKCLRNSQNCGMHTPKSAGSQPPKIAESDPAILRDVVYTIKEQENNNKKQQQQATAAVSSKSSSKEQPSPKVSASEEEAEIPPLIKLLTEESKQEHLPAKNDANKSKEKSTLKIPAKETNRKLPASLEEIEVPGLGKCFMESKQIVRKHFPILDDIDIPVADKEEISRVYSQEVVKNAIEWATDASNPPTKCLAASIKFACKNKLKRPVEKKDVESENRSYAMKYDGLKNATSQVDVYNTYVEVANCGVNGSTTIAYKEKGFIEQFHNALRKNNFKIKENIYCDD